MRALAFALVAVALAGCGGGASPHTPPAAGGREWSSGASQLVSGLDEALGRVAEAGVGRRTLVDTSALYEAVLGYTYIGTCSDLLAQLGEPAPPQREVRDLLRSACAELVRASAVFTRAVERTSAALLVAAARDALDAAPLLRRAMALLHRSS